MTRSIWGWLLCGLLAAPSLAAQNRLEFEVPGSASPGEVISVGLLLDHDIPLRAWQVSVCHPGLERVDVSFGTGVAFQASFVDPDFIAIEAFSETEAFATSGTFSNPLFYLPSVGNRELHLIEFTSATVGIYGLTLCENEIDGISWSNQISGPVTPGQPVFVAPDLQSATVAYNGPFLRGDCQVSGSLGLTDVLTLLFFTFQGVNPGNCPEACDIDADGSMTLSDAILLLSFLFQSGAPPAAPFPCGEPAEFFFGCLEGCAP